MGFKIESSLLEACVLAVLSRGDTYGYVLTQSMKSVLGISESTLYPVLRRLQKGAFLRTYDQPYQGRNRRYYTITETGRERFRQYQEEWSRHKERIDSILLDASADRILTGLNGEAEESVVNEGNSTGGADK